MNLPRFCSILLLIALFCSFDGTLSAADKLPNILWITSEDNGPHLGCYGDDYATTPNLDKLAEKSLRYTNCWSNAPVCAPARTTLISGMFPTSTGSQHMRSEASLPEGFKMYPQYLKAAGYYCTNNSKEDYNLKKPVKDVWDDSSRKAHWKNRKDGQPFFAIFNHTISHESQIRNKIDPKDRIHDPAKVRIPAYHPDTPEVRDNWAQYYDRITMMDIKVGQNLKELEAAGLADDTIIFYYGDHGSGMPRSKRWPYNSGLLVPLIVHIPEKWQHLAPKEYKAGAATDRLVSFVDMAPTLLSLAGVKPPEHFHGYAFLGEHATEEQPYIYGFRGRMDERYDMVRTIRNKRYIYIRNFMPHKVYGQHVAYMFQTPTTRVWKEMFDAGKLNEAQSHFWKRKPFHELYDLENDPDEVNNLADSKEHQKVVAELSRSLARHLVRTRDVGFLPEGMIHDRAAKHNVTPYEMGHNDALYPMKHTMVIASAATSGSALVDQLSGLLKDDDDAIRYWAAMGLLIQGQEAVAKSHEQLAKAMNDESPYVAIVAAEALARFDDDEHGKKAVRRLLELSNAEKHGQFSAIAALNAVDQLDKKFAEFKDEIQALPKKAKNSPGRVSGYPGRLLEKTLSDLK